MPLERTNPEGRIPILRLVLYRENLDDLEQGLEKSWHS
jgi:hypothetical protein